MTEKLAKSVIDHFHHAHEALNVRLDQISKLKGNEAKRQVFSLARTVDKQVAESQKLKESLGVSDLEPAKIQADKIKNKFAKISMLLRLYYKNEDSPSHLTEAKKYLEEGMKAVNEIEKFLHKHDDMHIGHANSAPRVKYKPKKNQEAEQVVN